MHFHSLLRILAIAEKEWVQIRRDMRSLLLSIGLPIVDAVPLRLRALDGRDAG